MPQSPESARIPAAPPARHQTLAITETHRVGRDRRPASHSILQRIVALETLDRIPYRFDTNEVRKIAVGEGITLGEQRALGNSGYYMAELILGRTLNVGEQTRLEYTTYFNYTNLPPPLYRRGVGANPLPLLDMCVQFENGCAPQHIWEAQWYELEGSGTLQLLPGGTEVSLQESPTIPEMTEVRRQEVDVAPGTMLGFRWEW